MKQRGKCIFMSYAALVVTAYLLSGCVELHKRTNSFCNGQLYVETVTVGPFGVDADYLTDRQHFRLKVGTCDNEHEDFVYSCRGDTIQVVKVDQDSKNCRWVTLPDSKQTLRCDRDTVENTVYSLQALRKNSVFE